MQRSCELCIPEEEAIKAFRPDMYSVGDVSSYTYDSFGEKDENFIK